MPKKLVVLGSTGYHPNETRHTLCLVLPEEGIVLDAGTAMFRLRHWVRTSSLDVILSHAHLDHVVGLTFLFDVLHEQAVERVVVHASHRTLEAVRLHLLAEPLFPVALPCEFRELPQRLPLPSEGWLTHFPLVHPGGCTGFRLDWPGSSMAYVTDTVADPAADYVNLIRGVNLLVHECYFPDRFRELAIKTGHSHTTPVAQVARAAEVGRMVLVHMNPLVEGPDPIEIDVARSIFPDTELAYDGMELEF